MVVCRNHRGEQKRGEAETGSGLSAAGVGNTACKGNRRCSRGADMVGGSMAGGQHNGAPGALGTKENDR